MFLNNKYTNWYYSIINSVKSKQRNYNSDVYEKHHIIPRSLGGIDNEENIIILTFREHFLCHLLLTKMTSGKNKTKMCFALHCFFYMICRYHHRPVASRHYDYMKRICAQAFKDRIPHTKTETFLFKYKNDDPIELTRYELKTIGNLTGQEIYNLIEHRYAPGCWHSKGWGIYDDKRKEFSHEKKKLTYPHKRLRCPHCGTWTNGGNYNRWHGDNCKSKPAT